MLTKTCFKDQFFWELLKMLLGEMDTYWRLLPKPRKARPLEHHSQCFCRSSLALSTPVTSRCSIATHSHLLPPSMRPRFAAIAHMFSVWSHAHSCRTVAPPTSALRACLHRTLAARSSAGRWGQRISALPEKSVLGAVTTVNAVAAWMSPRRAREQV